jgi:hypothetical protein
LIQEATGGGIVVGPESVGYRITKEALVFGGRTMTATDVAVALGIAPGVGDPSAVSDLSATIVEGTKRRIKAMLEVTLDSMKTTTGVCYI